MKNTKPRKERIGLLPLLSQVLLLNSIFLGITEQVIYCKVDLAVLSCTCQFRYLLEHRNNEVLNEDHIIT